LAVSTTLKQGLTLLNTTNQAIAALLTITKLEQRLKNLATSARLQWPIINFREIDKYKQRQKKIELQECTGYP
jgi:hypothetical protein